MNRRLCPTCNEEHPATHRVCPDCGDVLFDEMPPGPLSAEILDGRYELRNVLGSGAMGCVYDAIDTQSGRKVAIKLLNENSLAGRSSTYVDRVHERLKREADVLRSIPHPGVVKILDFIIDGEHGRYIVMEKLRGHTLEVLRRAGRLARPSDAVGFLEQVSEIMGAAHRENIVHRDLKPSNVIHHRPTDGDPIVKVIDFGIAKILDSLDTSLSIPGQFIGTLNYAAPEQLDGAQADPRMDVYSIAAILFHVIAGRPPFQSDSTYELITMKSSKNPPWLSRFVGGIPRRLDALVNRCLSRRPEMRPENGAELAALLRGISFEDAELVDRSSARPTSASLVGECLDDRYSIQEWVGPGRFGSQVYVAMHLQMRRKVALRLWTGQEGAILKALTAALQNESRAIGVRHPNLIAILDMNIGDEYTYLVTELIDSHSLRYYLNEEKSLTPEKVIELFRPVFEACSELHQQGVVSGILTPETIRAAGSTRPERLYISPFGITDPEQFETLRSADHDTNFVSYVAPELKAGVCADSRSDVYTLALIFLETLWPGSKRDLEIQQIDISRQGYTAADFRLGPTWDEFLTRALNNEPARRFADCTEMLAAMPQTHDA